MDRFGGRSIPEIYIPATFNSYVPLIWIETKTLALKVYCGHLACQRSGPSLPLFTQEPQKVPLVSKIGRICEGYSTNLVFRSYVDFIQTTNYLGILR